jgi:hypothetical protein
LLVIDRVAVPHRRPRIIADAGDRRLHLRVHPSRRNSQTSSAIRTGSSRFPGGRSSSPYGSTESAPSSTPRPGNPTGLEPDPPRRSRFRSAFGQPFASTAHPWATSALPAGYAYGRRVPVAGPPTKSREAVTRVDFGGCKLAGNGAEHAQHENSPTPERRCRASTVTARWWYAGERCTAHKYCNAIDRERSRQAATGQRTAPATARATLLPRVRIERVRGSNPISSTFPQVKGWFQHRTGSLGFRTAPEYSNPSQEVACRAACARFWSWLSALATDLHRHGKSGCADGSAWRPGTHVQGNRERGASGES